MMIIGRTAIMTPVAIMPTSSVRDPMKYMMPNGSVRLLSSVSSTTAYEVFVPEHDEIQHHGCENRGKCDRQRNTQENLDVPIAIDPRGIEQVLGICLRNLSRMKIVIGIWVAA